MTYNISHDRIGYMAAFRPSLNTRHMVKMSEFNNKQVRLFKQNACLGGAVVAYATAMIE